jgi:hypothetical protein
MAARVVPSACPRCRRSVETWTIDREPGRRDGRAGCPCGEVIDVAFEDERNVGPALSSTPKRPRGWSEDARPDAWRATLRPDMRRLLILTALSLPYWFARIVLAARSVADIAMFIAFLAVITLYGTLLRRRQWTFAIEGGRFRVDAAAVHQDIALEEILRFELEKTRKEDQLLTPRGGALYQLSVHRTAAPPISVQLNVESADEAQFIVDRANAVLASGGHIVDAGYRGERIRVAVEEPAATSMEDAEETDDAATRRRASRAGSDRS